MTAPERFERVQELFHAALKLPPEERLRFINSLDDESLRRELGLLLAADETSTGLLKTAAALHAQSAPALAIGSKLGGYEITAPIDAGGMGEVYRARDLKLHREVAVKVLPESLANDPERIVRFRREAQLLASLNHPHIAVVYGLEESNGTLAIVMELVEGPTLAERLTGGPLPLKEVLGVAQQMAEALEAAHERGIVHRDLKPANVKITPEGSVKILDFGLGKVVNADGSPAVTRTGMILGTAAYMSPEQARGAAIDKRADIWAFGVVLYEMLTGRLPFTGDTAADVIASAFKDEPDLNGLPPQTTVVIARCLSKDPRNRWGSMGDVRWALGGASTLAVFAGPDSQEAPGKTTRRRLIYGAGAVALGGAGFAAAWMLRPASKLPPRFREIPTPLGQPVRDAGAIHPDGRSLVYRNKDAAGEPMVHHDLQSGLTRDLGLPSGSEPLSISVNGELAFLRDHILYRTPLATPAPRGVMENVSYAAWSSDGSALLVLRTSGGKYRIEFPIGNVLYETSNRISMVCLSRRHNRVAFIERIPGKEFQLALLESPGRKRVFFDVDKGHGLYKYGNPFWSVDEREVWASPFEGGDHSAIQAYDDSGRRRVVIRLPGWVRPLGISEAGDILLTVVSEESRVLIAEPGSAGEREIPMDARVHATSLDGRAFVLARWKDDVNHSDLYLYQAGAAAPALIGTGYPNTVSFSPDEKWVHADRGSGAVLIPTGPGEERRLVVPGLKSPVVLAWLPDGKRMLLRDYSVDKLIYLWEDGSAPTPMPFEDPIPNALMVSPDGRRFVYSNPREWRMCVIESGVPATLPGIDAREKVFGWTGDSAGLFVGKPGGPDLTIYRYRLGSGSRSLWKTLSSNRSDTVPFDVWIAPDGRAYGYSLFRSTARLVLAEGVG
ncbi:MAG TPA: protein kinase [Bryobacteraceae bacterium]